MAIASFMEDFRYACGVVTELYDRAASIACAHALTICLDRKLPVGVRARQSPWIKILDIEGREPEYRVQFNVCLNRSHPPGTACIWYITTDLKTGQWYPVSHDDVLLYDLKKVLSKCFDDFLAKLEANAGIDPVEMARQRRGTAYYWAYEREDGMSSWSTDFDGELWTGEVVGSDSDYEGSLTDPASTDPMFVVTGSDETDLMLQIEKAYRDRETPTVG